MNRRYAVIVVAVVLAASVLAPAVAVAQSGNATATTTTTTTSSNTTTTATTTAAAGGDGGRTVADVRDGEYTIGELTESGNVVANTKDKSLRSLGDPPMGFVQVRYHDPTLIDAIFGDPGQWKMLEPGDVVRQNIIQLRSSAFGEVAGEYKLTVVYWQRDTVEINNRTVAYAANQTIDTYTVEIGTGDTLYSLRNISLREHYENTWRVAMWLSQDGERVDGAKWRFRHRSNPEAMQMSINSAAGAWGWAISNVAIPAVASVIVGLLGARLTLRKISRGPGYGVLTWLVLLGIVGTVVSLVAYYQIAVILRYFPHVIGLSVGAVAYGVGLTWHPPEKKIGFFRRELNDAVVMPGRETDDDGNVELRSDSSVEVWEELTEAMKADLPEVPAVKTDETYRVPVKGIKPAIARLFANAAELNVDGIATREKIDEGRLDDIIHVDPDSDVTIRHEPATLKRVLPIDTLPDDYEWYEELVAYVLTAGIVLVPAGVGFIAFDALMNIPSVGVLLGLVVTATIAYSAEDGIIEFTAAAPHYKTAEDNLTILQRAHKEAKQDMSAQEEAWVERGTTAKEAKEYSDREKKNVTDRVLEALGAADVSERDAGGDDDDAT